MDKVNLRKESDDQIIAQADVDFSRWVHETWMRNRPRVELNALIGPLRDAHPAPLFRYVPWG